MFLLFIFSIFLSFIKSSKISSVRQDRNKNVNNVFRNQIGTKDSRNIAFRSRFPTNTSQFNQNQYGLDKLRDDKIKNIQKINNQKDIIEQKTTTNAKNKSSQEINLDNRIPIAGSDMYKGKNNQVESIKKLEASKQNESNRKIIKSNFLDKKTTIEDRRVDNDKNNTGSKKRNSHEEVAIPKFKNDNPSGKSIAFFSIGTLLFALGMAVLL